MENNFINIIDVFIGFIAGVISTYFVMLYYKIWVTKVKILFKKKKIEEKVAFVPVERVAFTNMKTKVGRGQKKPNPEKMADYYSSFDDIKNKKMPTKSNTKQSEKNITPLKDVDNSKNKLSEKQILEYVDVDI